MRLARSLKVHRSELLAQLEESNKQAASPPANAVDSLLTAIRDRAKDA